MTHHYGYHAVQEAGVVAVRELLIKKVLLDAVHLISAVHKLSTKDEPLSSMAYRDAVLII